MRGTHTFVNDLRKKVFAEVARLAYEGGDYERIEEIPYRIIPGEVAEHRQNIFLERAIVGERLRLAIGLPLRPVAAHAPVGRDIKKSAIAQKYYDPPLVNIIPFACNACPEKQVLVTNACQGCLAHPCQAVCPVSAVSIVEGKSVIDKEKCINCGRCIEECPYNAIIKIERPCAAACGADAIGSDELGRAKIDYDKCVSCGMCLVNCPFSAIADKSQIFQLIHAIKEGHEVIAAIAPAFIGQFGKEVTPAVLKAAFREIGVADVVEVAVGADLAAIEEAEHFLEKVPHAQPFVATSCCPSWSVMAKNLYPDLALCISMTLTPMVVTARLIKKEHPNAKVVFVGPCAAKKLEASRRSIRSDVDFVLTFEELMGIFEAKEIDFAALTPTAEDDFTSGTRAGRGFPVIGGVANAVVDVIELIDPSREVPVDYASGLRECRKLLALARAGKRDGYLIEGMACPGGCIAGAGIIQPIARSTAAVEQYRRTAPLEKPVDSPFTEWLGEVHEWEDAAKKIDE
ncbi:MAG: 4Fe-4S dicluster domain-containing protein [Christensenellaceae bacterium]